VRITSILTALGTASDSNYRANGACSIFLRAPSRFSADNCHHDSGSAHAGGPDYPRLSFSHALPDFRDRYQSRGNRNSLG
ncbi:MAG: hypothetical protein ACRERV_06895, partial [Methylococcales bacterium]